MKLDRHRARGFTLIELVVAMLVMAILVSIAIPGYRTYSLKAHRTDAKSSLLYLASLEERYYSTANAYSSAPSDLGFASGAAWPQTVGSGYYTVSVSNVNAATASSVGTYTITASAVGQQAADTTCQSLTVIQDGTQTASPGPASNCW